MTRFLAPLGIRRSRWDSDVAPEAFGLGRFGWLWSPEGEMR